MESTSVPGQRYETLPHTADVAIRAYGATVEQLFANAAFALFDVSYVWADNDDQEMRVVVADGTLEERLVDFLAELIWLSESHRLAFHSFQVERTGTEKIEVVATGTGIDRLDTRGPPIKAVTYHGLRVESTPDGWIADLVFDV
jgi:SHS2 domain-containing protein